MITLDALNAPFASIEVNLIGHEDSPITVHYRRCTHPETLEVKHTDARRLGVFQASVEGTGEIFKVEDYTPLIRFAARLITSVEGVDTPWKDMSEQNKIDLLSLFPQNNFFEMLNRSMWGLEEDEKKSSEKPSED